MVFSMQNSEGKVLLMRSVRWLVVGITVFVGLVFILRDMPEHEFLDRTMAAISNAGPWVYFSMMALLPAFGVPMLGFLLPAGAIFGQQLGIGTVIILSLTAVSVNLIFTYYLARYAMHGIIQTLLKKVGHKLPIMDRDDSTHLTVVLRVTPGIPFFVQNYLLGIARVPFVPYLLVSCFFSWTYAVAYVLFGDALLHGKAKVAVMAISMFIAALAATHIARRHYAKRATRRGVATRAPHA